MSTCAAAALDGVPDPVLAEADGVGAGRIGGAATCVGGAVVAGAVAAGAAVAAGCVGAVLGVARPRVAGVPVPAEPEAPGSPELPAAVLPPDVPGAFGVRAWHRPECAAHGRDDASCSAIADPSWSRISA